MNNTSESKAMIKKSTKKEKKPFLVELPSYVLIIFLVLVFRALFFEPFKIPSGSMIPTLLIGDYILVNKFSYGLKLPFSDWYKEPIYVGGSEQPHRGDVIVFKFPDNPSIYYIKRVIGLPGDRIKIINRNVYINNEPIKVEQIDGSAIMEDMDDKYKNDSFTFLKTYTGNHTHVTQLTNGIIPRINSLPETVIPSDSFFVMGDNRDNSSDSRVWGFVPFENVKGKAKFIWFSMSLPISFDWLFFWKSDMWEETGHVTQDNGFKFRPWRIGKAID